MGNFSHSLSSLCHTSPPLLGDSDAVREKAKAEDRPFTISDLALCEALKGRALWFSEKVLVLLSNGFCFIENGSAEFKCDSFNAIVEVMEENSSTLMDGEITSIRFGLATHQEICTASISDSSISHASQLSNPFLGLPLEYGRCESCGTSEPGKCEGHFGYIELPVPVYHPSHVSELKRMLSLICLNCLKIKKSKSPVASNGIAQRLVSPCCEDVNASQISIREVKTTDGACYLALKAPKSRLLDGFWKFLDKYGYRYGQDTTRTLLPCEALEIIKRIPPETKRKLAGKGYSPQDGYVLKYLPVPPNCLSVPEVSDGITVMSSDPSMTILRKVLRRVEIIKSSRSGVPNFESHQVEANDLQCIVDQYLQVRGSGKASRDIETHYGVNKELNESSSKAWLEKMRTLFIRKGSGFSSRSVITGEVYKRINEVGIPLEVAQKITFEERVSTHNVRYLQDLVDKNLCLTFKEGHSTYSLREGSKGHTYLKPGQIVHRRIMDGDTVFINRPPTTHKHSLQALAVYIHDDHTVKINPLICGPLGADFDGDCVHLFYPQSLAAKAEVLELFSMENQLLSSHSGNLNLQLGTDSVLSLKMLSRECLFDKVAAQQLAMLLSQPLPHPAFLKVASEGPCWTPLQILQCALPSDFDCSADQYLIRQSEILDFDFSRDVLPSVINEIAASIFFGKGPKEVMKFFDVIQPFLMESLYYEGFSVGLQDFSLSRPTTSIVCDEIGKTSRLLDQLRKNYNELVEQQVEKEIQALKRPVINFAKKSTRLGDLVDSKSASAMDKVVQQMGFLGMQLSDRGKFYSKALTEDVADLFRTKYCDDEGDYPSAECGLLKGCFFHGLDPYEEMVHSISTREVIVRSSRGLSEPGTLFKNLMAILRDVTMCYDGTVRNVCSNSIIQFEYGGMDENRTRHLFPAGEPVGVLAATAMSNPAYKAVLDASPSSNSSWELMKETLLCKVNFRNEPIDRRVILYLNECGCGMKYCQESAAYLVKNHLRKVSLKEITVDFSIEYQKQRAGVESYESDAGLVGHIHLDELMLKEMKINMPEVIQRCQETIKSFHRKKRLSYIFKRTLLFSCECCTFSQSSAPCVMFLLQDGGDTQLDKISRILADIICPVLLETIIKGDPRISSASIIWVNPDTNMWVPNPSKSSEGELALDILLDKAAVKESGDAWRTVLDSCLPVLHLIDVNRSVPYAIKQVQELLGISSAFDQAIQRLAASVRMVAKGVLKEHLILLASSMTSGGNMVGFNTGGYKALSRQLNVQVPFTEATLFTPKKCFERASEKCHADSLSSIVASCSWGKHVAVGTGSRFDILWDAKEVQLNENGPIDAYNFLHMVKSATTQEGPNNACLGEDVDDLMEEEIYDWDMSPEHSSGFGRPVFEDDGDVEKAMSDMGKDGWQQAIFGNSQEDLEKGNGWSTWRNDRDGGQDVPSKGNNWSSWSKNNDNVSPKRDAWSAWGSSNFGNSAAEEQPSQTWDHAKSRTENSTWGKPKSPENQGWEPRKEVVESTSGWTSSKSGDSAAEEQPSQTWDHAKLPTKNSTWGKPKSPEYQGWEPRKEVVESMSGWASSKSGDSAAEEQPSKNSSWGKPKSSENQGWDAHIEANEPTNSSGWNSQISGGNSENERSHQWGKRGREPFKKSRFEGSRDMKNRKMANDDAVNKLFTATRQRLDSFSSEEQDILKDVEPIIHSIRRIMSGYNDGDPLSAEDQNFVLENIFGHHPNKAEKEGDGIDHVMVNKHSSFQESRCFYVVLKDGRQQDFSYRKCLDSFIKGKYPNIAEEFISKYFSRRPRAPGTREQTPTPWNREQTPTPRNREQSPNPWREQTPTPRNREQTPNPWNQEQTSTPSNQDQSSNPWEQTPTPRNQDQTPNPWNRETPWFTPTND
ncbi:hypothetical protein L6164_023145 [Bauhinia variegata]|uniref:Uncharacterized protein n=1 Tax=Bauhinia variegata TaxID=167791 RepID=A0ACB9MHA4_BAUVA|nr:hypothetical protein L6164_023145 [Bauhinia variegata]